MKEIDYSNNEITEKDKRRLKKIKINLMRSEKFALWSGILMLGSTKLSNTLPTACTNGRDDTYGVQFMRACDDLELGFVILHEGLHKAFRHMSTWRVLFNKNPELANWACDYVINLIAVDCDPQETIIKMPRKPNGGLFGLYDTKYEGMHAGQVFKLLEEEQEEEGEGGEGEPCDDGEEGEGQGGGQSGGGHGGFDEHDWEGAEEMTEPEAKELEAEVDRAIRQGQIAAKRTKGTGSSLGDRALEELLAPQFDWRDLLKEFMVNTCRTPDASTWRRPNRRFLHQGIYMPTLIGESMGEIVVAVDTSGSVSDAEIVIFLSEIKGICELVKPAKMHLLYWDGEVAKPHEQYELDNLDTLEDSTRVMGGGGTSPSCISPYLKKEGIEPECIVVLTDGWLGGDWGQDWVAPMLWVVSGDSNAVSPFGKTVYVEDWT